MAAHAWDESRSDQIADGIDVGGIDVAGLTEREAESLLTQELIEPLDRDLVATYDGVKYKLSAERLAVRADIEGMIDEAFAASQDGGLPTRPGAATSGEVDESIEPEVVYDKGEVAAFVDRVATEIDREPVNASVEPSSASIDPVPGQEGRTVRQDELHQEPDRRRPEP